jgi:HEAT repeat protein
MALAVAGAAPLPGVTRERALKGSAPSLLKISADFSTYPATKAGTMNGVIMQRVIGFAIATIAFSSIGGVPVVASGAGGGIDGQNIDQRGGRIDVVALLGAARGAPPMICALASRAVRGYGWGGGSDAPATPLASVVTLMRDDFNDDRLTTADVQQLLAGLASDDACVREMAVRLIGTQRGEAVGAELVSRLSATDPNLRTVAALGLGLVEPQNALDPLIRALRDPVVDVRANSAWALGRIENGRALPPLMNLFSDDAEKVREAAVAAVGHMESTSAVPALIRVLRQDSSPRVRRVAAWALGELEARDAIDALGSVLARDADPGVREMAAWALGSIEDRRGAAPLAAAIRSDAEDRVRETAVWALGQMEDRSSIEVLGAATGDRSARVRGTAAWAIGQLDENGAKAPAGLLRLLRDENDDTRLKAAWALGQIEDPGALPAIRDALRLEKSDRVRKGLIRALMKSGERSEEALSQLLSSSDPQVREAAVRGLAGRHAFDPWPWPWPRPRPFP